MKHQRKDKTLTTLKLHYVNGVLAGIPDDKICVLSQELVRFIMQNEGGKDSRIILSVLVTLRYKMNNTVLTKGRVCFCFSVSLFLSVSLCLSRVCVYIYVFMFVHE